MADFSPSISGTSPWRSAESVRPADDAVVRPTRAPDALDQAPGRSADSVELSDRARLIASLRGAQAPRESDQTFRPDLVERIRREIESGQYESITKETIAADRLARSLGASIDRQA